MNGRQKAEAAAARLEQLLSLPEGSLQARRQKEGFQIVDTRRDAVLTPTIRRDRLEIWIDGFVGGVEFVIDESNRRRAGARDE